MIASIQTSTTAHALQLAMRANRKDMDEIMAASGREPLEMVLHALEASSKSYTIMNGDEPVAMLGAAPDDGGEAGRLWMLSGDIPPVKSVLRYSLPHLIDGLLEGYTMLWNFIDSRQIERIEWLLALGFQFGDEMYYGTSKVPFYKFWKFGSEEINV